MYFIMYILYLCIVSEYQLCTVVKISGMHSIIYIMHAALYSALHVCIESIVETKNLFKTALISTPVSPITDSQLQSRNTIIISATL